MMDCKPMTTLMNSNLKLLQDDSSEAFDLTVYRQLIGSLMYLVKHQTEHLFCSERIEPIYGGSKTGSLDNDKACAQVPEGYNWIWTQLCLGSENGAARI